MKSLFRRDAKEKKEPSNDSYFPPNSSKLLFNSVELRDGQQSLLSTRITTSDMIPILEKMDLVGYHAIEMWGGATFDVCVRYLGEDPWERLRTIRKAVKKTPLKMLLRGQNLLGYAPYADDVVERFVACSAKNGIDVIEVFDALQDMRGCETAIRAVKRAGKTAEGGLMYTLSPLHDIAKFVEIGKAYEAMGVDALHIEDMAGLMTPKVSYELVTALKKELRIPLFLQCHCTTGLAQMCYWEAIRAGVDGVDTCVSTLSLGPGHPPTESIVAAVKGTKRDSGLDLKLLGEIGEYFKRTRAKYKQYETELVGVDIGCLQHQIPGGMLTNLEMQLKSMNAYDRLPEALAEAVDVRRDFGYPPLGTPSSQIVGAQAVANVLTGERYKMISKQAKDYVKGMYGKQPGCVSAELIQKALGDEQPINCRPADLIQPQYEKFRAESADFAKCEEDILTYAMFPNIARDFLKRKYGVED